MVQLSLHSFISMAEKKKIELFLKCFEGKKSIKTFEIVENNPPSLFGGSQKAFLRDN